ncbi:hypothetical protein EBX31_07065 [bacterium]|nr:hypothetical protein [bacterium]
MSATYTVLRSFSPAMCRAIIHAHKEGYSVQDISSLFNIKYNQIYKFLVINKYLTPTKKAKANENK